MDFDLKGEILFKDGLEVHFKCYRGQQINTIKYFDENNKEVPYNKIWGRRYEYCKLASIDGTLLYQNNVIARPE
ncbi:hypothetical protein H5984_03350 [Ligilactobacillus salivarius]|uniref:hypothetical protein n=1 Tax=Ligilactobacillus salivarius TaxID=1624 RepID=UPI00195ADB06|nr:hypothetical protein [Ligilactobacillus salivarius]MBM6707792.1 hypothetical protein [Ligilactobacillus salivarius]